MDFKRVLKNSFIPVAFDVTSNGIVESATVFKPLLPKAILKNNEVDLNPF